MGRRMGWRESTQGPRVLKLSAATQCDSSFRYFPDAERMERLYCLRLPVSVTGRDIVTRRGKRKMDNGTLRDEKAYEAIQTGRLPTRSAPSRHECGEATPIDVAKSHEEPAGIPEEHARVLLAAIVESSDDAIVEDVGWCHHVLERRRGAYVWLACANGDRQTHHAYRPRGPARGRG